MGLRERAGWAVWRLPAGQRQMENWREFHCSVESLLSGMYLHQISIFSTLRVRGGSVSFTFSQLLNAKLCLDMMLILFLQFTAKKKKNLSILSECNHPGWFQRKHSQWANERGSYSHWQEFPLAHRWWRRHDRNNVKWPHPRPACIHSKSPVL